MQTSRFLLLLMNADQVHSCCALLYWFGDLPVRALKAR